jgi:hypothetical protein
MSSDPPPMSMGLQPMSVSSGATSQDMQLMSKEPRAMCVSVTHVHRLICYPCTRVVPSAASWQSIRSHFDIDPQPSGVGPRSPRHRSTAFRRRTAATSTSIRGSYDIDPQAVADRSTAFRISKAVTLASTRSLSGSRRSATAPRIRANSARGRESAAPRRANHGPSSRPFQ